MSVPTRRISIGFGIYEERRYKDAADRTGRATGKYYHRFRIDRHPTWRLLKNVSNRTEAKEAISKIKTSGDSFAALAAQYLKSGCPTSKRKWKPAGELAQKEEAAHVAKLNGFYARKRIGEINLGSLRDYFDWRTHGQTEKPTRQVDKEIQTLSNVINYAVVITEQIEVNKIRSNRTKFHSVKSNARDRMPATAEVVHTIAEYFFNNVRSEVFGWLTYFSQMTGARCSELRRLRTDAAPRQAGHIEFTASFNVPEHGPIYTGTGYLDLGRRSKQKDDSKRGVSPKCVLWPEFRKMIECFLYWHQQRYPESKWFFPGLAGIGPVDKCSFNHAMRRALVKLELPNITPHGFRSYFCTKLYRDGFRQEEISERIGDKTVDLQRSVYSDVADGERLAWNPKDRLPGYLRWQPANKKIVALGR